MTTNKQTYKVGKQRMLVDLNGNLTNFDLTFTATSKNGESFDIIVVDQETLDSSSASEMQYKTAEGSISGNILADKNNYQNYYLCLKANKPTDVDIEITRKQVQPQPPPQQRQQPPPQQRQQPPPQLIPPTKAGTNWKMISIVVVILGGSALLYYFYIQNKNKINSSVVPSPILPSPILPSPSDALSPDPSGLLAKLKGLSMS